MDLKETLLRLARDWAHTGIREGVDRSLYDHKAVKRALLKANFEQANPFPHADCLWDSCYGSFAAFVYVKEGPESPQATCLPRLWKGLVKDHLESAKSGVAWLLLAAYGKDWPRAMEGQEEPLKRLLYTALMNDLIKPDWINKPWEGREQTNNLMLQDLLSACMTPPNFPRFHARIRVDIIDAPPRRKEAPEWE